MAIRLKPELRKFVENEVRRGRFSSESAAMNEALQLLKEQEQFMIDNKEWIRREVAKGIEQADRGDFVEFDAKSIIAEGRARRAKKEAS